MVFSNRFLSIATGLITIVAIAAAPTQVKSTEQTTHWRYAGANGPDHWGELTQQFALCGSGKRQSPIDIRAAKPADLYPLRFDYRPIRPQILNNGHTLQANYNTSSIEQLKIGATTHSLPGISVYDSRMRLGDVPYQLLQFHFHTPSEHALNGQRYPMEVHLVHKNSDGNLAVIGIFLKKGKPNATVQTVLDNASTKLNKVNTVKNTLLNVAALLPKNRRFYHYNGSLTTPPCSENVNWFVMREPIEASSAQISRFTEIIGNNARPLQAVHWREVYISK
ncbi:MAG: carbonic anhydrase family protein [Exilibacterium sp.]